MKPYARSEWTFPKDAIEEEKLKYLLSGLLFGFLVGCTAMLPMDEKSAFNDEDVKRVMAITQLPESAVRDPTIHEVHEVKLSFWQMQEECYPSVRWYMKLLGSFPLACTKIIQQPWKEKVAIIYYSDLTDRWTMNHEREHAKGKLHAYW